MSQAQTEQKNDRMITTYIPVFKDKLAKLERRGLGRCEEARRLRATIARVEESSSLLEGNIDDRPFLVAAE